MTNLALNQHKLDVIDKTRSNIFDWRGQFTPEFVEYIIDEFAKPGDTIADIFSGSGTVLYEALQRGYNAIGFEINPSAYFMSKFYEYSKLSLAEREILFEKFRALFGHAIVSLDSGVSVYTDAPSYRDAYKNLLSFAKYCSLVTTSELTPLIANVLFSSEKDKKMSLKESLIKNVLYFKEQLFKLPEVNSIVEANWGDARSIATKYTNNVDLIITSPPYINVFNYHQNYRGIVECFGYNLLNVANSEIGSNRKHRQNRFMTVVQYAMDMGRVLESSAESLTQNGRMIWIVGRLSNVRKTPFYNSRIIKDLVDKIEGLDVYSINSRKFNNRFGKEIIEDIIVINKVSPLVKCNDIHVYKEIGLQHLANAASICPSSEINGLNDILNHVDLVEESPILN